MHVQNVLDSNIYADAKIQKFHIRPVSLVAAYFGKK